MTHAIRVHAHGGAGLLCWDVVNVGEPGPGGVLPWQTSCGLNCIDICKRDGLYPAGELPAVRRGGRRGGW